MTWDEYFLEIAEVVSKKAKDSTKVGCVIVGKDNQILSTGWNGFSRGVQDLPERMERPTKHDYTVHSEINAIANAARSGVSLNGATLYCSHAPCKNCAAVIVQAGIAEVVYGGGQLIGDYGLGISEVIFKEGNVRVRSVG